MREHTELLALVDHRLIDVLRHRDRTERHVGGRDRLRHRDRVRLHPEGLGAPHVAGAPEAADYLVRDERDVVVAQDRLHLLEVRLRRHDHAPGTHHRFGDEGRDRIGAFLFDHRLELAREPRGELFLGLAVPGVTVVVGAIRVQDTRDRQVEISVKDRQAGQAPGRDGDAVIRPHPRDDLLLLRLAARIVVVPRELDLGVVGFAARTREEHLRDRDRRDLLDLLRELDRRLMAAAAEEMRERELGHLLARGFDQLGIAVAERRAPQSRQAFDIFLAGRVPDVDAFGALEQQRPGGPVGREVGRGMQQRLDVTSRKVGERGHGTRPILRGNSDLRWNSDPMSSACCRR